MIHLLAYVKVSPVRYPRNEPEAVKRQPNVAGFRLEVDTLFEGLEEGAGRNDLPLYVSKIQHRKIHMHMQLQKIRPKKSPLKNYVTLENHQTPPTL